MLNSKETLKNLHEKFPNLSLDDLFIILDCYKEEYSFNYPVSSSPYKLYKDYIICNDNTTGVDKMKNVTTCNWKM